MKPTFLRVGVPKNTVRPPTTIRPPTQPGLATLPATFVCTYEDSDPDTSHPWDLPAAQVGDLVVAGLFVTNGPTTITTPTGWTKLGEQTNFGGRLGIYYRVFDGTETTPTTFDTGGATDYIAYTWIAGRGIDFTVNPPEVAFGVGNGGSAFTDPPAITPTPGAGDYHVFAGGVSSNSAAYPDGNTEPSGYTFLGKCSIPGEYSMSGGYKVVSIATSEDPGTFGVAVGVGRFYISFTVAVLKSASEGTIATGDHTHTLTDSDITDIDVTTTAPTVGDLLRFDGTDWIPALPSRFVATADNVIANTVTETTLFGTGIGSLTLPANYLRAGRTIDIDIRGRLAATGNPNRTIKLKLGSTVITSLGPTAIASVSGTVEFRIQLLLTCRAAGASGTVIAGGVWSHSNGTFRSLSSGSTATVDTTGTLVLDVTWEWGTADAANTITSKEAVVW